MQNKYGKTPLHCAVSSDKPSKDIINYLMEFKEKVNNKPVGSDLKDHCGKTVDDYLNPKPVVVKQVFEEIVFNGIRYRLVPITE